MHFIGSTQRGADKMLNKFPAFELNEIPLIVFFHNIILMNIYTHMSLNMQREHDDRNKQTQQK